jgi:uncharacterized phiE125 gp8 family phage protein
MWSEPVVTVAPGGGPVSLVEAKAHCRVTSSDEDTTIAIYLAAATGLVEKITGLRLVEQTVTFTRNDLLDEMPLPIAPIQSLTVAYLDTAGAEQTLSSGLYDFVGADTLTPAIVRKDGQDWPQLFKSPLAVEVTAVVGFDAAPAELKAAILLLTGHLFENREAVGSPMAETAMAVEALLTNFRLFGASI